jgi:hypothetical protein
LVLADQPGGELLVELAPRVGGPGVCAGELEPGLGPVRGALLFAGKGLLYALELLLDPAQEPG